MQLTHPVHETEGLVPPVGFGADQGTVARVGGKIENRSAVYNDTLLEQVTDHFVSSSDTADTDAN